MWLLYYLTACIQLPCWSTKEQIGGTLSILSTTNGPSLQNTRTRMRVHNRSKHRNLCIYIYIYCETHKRKKKEKREASRSRGTNNISYFYCNYVLKRNGIPMDCERWPRLFTSTPTSIDLPSNGNFVRKIKRVGSPIFRKLISRLSNVKKKKARRGRREKQRRGGQA